MLKKAQMFFFLRRKGVVEKLGSSPIINELDSTSGIKGVDPKVVSTVF